MDKIKLYQKITKKERKRVCDPNHKTSFVKQGGDGIMIAACVAASGTLFFCSANASDIWETDSITDQVFVDFSFLSFRGMAGELQSGSGLTLTVVISLWRVSASTQIRTVLITVLKSANNQEWAE